MKRILITLTILIITTLPVSAQIPRLMSYQGVLTDDMGVVVSDGVYNITFRIYDVATEGSHLWEETIAVNVSKGIFNATLGSSVLIEEQFNVPLYLSMAIDGGDELEPRRLFTPSGYAFSALAVFGDDNVFPSEGNVGIGSPSPLEKLDVGGAIRLGTTANTNAGTIRWSGIDFEGYNGSAWHSLTGSGGTGLPPGISGQMLHHDGVNWASTDLIHTDGNRINIGSPTTPASLCLESTAGGIRFDYYNQYNGRITVWARDPLGTPMFSLVRDSVAECWQELSADTTWTLIMNKDPMMKARGDGWTSFGGESIDESMNLPGALRLGTTAGSNAGTMRWTGSDFEGYNGSSWNSFTDESIAGHAGQTLRHDSAGWVADSFLVNTGTSLEIGESFKITEEGNFEGYTNGVLTSRLENNAGNTQYKVYNSDGHPNYSLFSFNLATGGSLKLWGGYLSEFSASSSSGGSLLSISSPTTWISLDARFTGNDAVRFPVDAISAREILDEPGVASIWYNQNNHAYIYSDWTTLATKTITAPTDGYVFLIASINLLFYNTSVIRLAITDSPDGNSFQSLYDAEANSNGTTLESFHDLYSVSAGEHTFYLLGKVDINDPNAGCRTRSLTAIFFHTNYGTVAPVLASSAGMTEGEIEAERTASIEANNARIERELAQMRAQIEELRAELEKANRQ